jgi:hypothetical protein
MDAADGFSKSLAAAHLGVVHGQGLEHDQVGGDNLALGIEHHRVAVDRLKHRLDHGVTKAKARLVAHLSWRGSALGDLNSPIFGRKPAPIQEHAIRKLWRAQGIYQ